MSGIFWHIVTFTAAGIFLILLVYRVIAIVRLPVHLRWELAPIPHEKGKGTYGGSYLEEYEWWHQPRHRSLVAPIIYMLREIFLLKSIWKNNPGLWPLSFSLHTGIFILIITLFLQILNAIFIIGKVDESVLNVTLTIANILAPIGFILGCLGAVGLILKRTLDADYRSFTTVTRYFHLVFLCAVFISGIYARFVPGDFALETSSFIKSLGTLDAGISVASPLAAHIIIFLLFLIYLPLTDMAHFIAKYFTYHHVRWNDAPQDERMTGELRRLLTLPVGWSGPHVLVREPKSWMDTTTGNKKNGEKT